MKKIILFSFFIFLLVQCVSDNRKQDYEVVKRVNHFSGKNIRDSDLTIHSHKDKGVISVSGNRERFFFILPYSEDWRVKYSDNSIVQFDSEEKNLIASVTLEKNPNEVEPEKFLQSLKSRIETRVGFKLSDSRIISGPTNKILAYFIEVTQNGFKIKSDNFWAIRQRPDNVILKLHLSTVNIPKENISKLEEALVLFMDTGFRVLKDEDFQ